MSRISGLNDLKKKDEDPEEKKNTEYFVGGLDQRGGGSGLSVQDPPPSSQDRAFESMIRSAFDNIVQRAQQNTESYDPSAASSNGDSIQITLYRNGFTVNDGPLRDLTSPENRLFLACLERGEVPQEIVAQRRGQNMEALDVKLMDKRSEDYIPPAYVAFSGPATTLGAATTSSSAIFAVDALRGVQTTGLSGPAATNNPVNLQLRTHDNKRLKLRVSASATVEQLAAIVASDASLPAGTRFTLTAGYPPKELVSGSGTVQDNNLANAAISLKLV